MDTGQRILPGEIRTGAPPHRISNTGREDFLSFYAQGTGANVGTLGIVVTNTTTFTILNGSAKFYSTSAGTTGESNMVVVTPLTTAIYVRCPSGSSTVKVSNVLNVTSFGGWDNATPAPGLIVNLNNWINLISINVWAANSTTLNLNNLNNVVFLRINSSQVTGSITRFESSLTYLQVNGAITGDISNCIKLVYYLQGAANQLTGSINLLTNIIFLTLTAGGTMPSITGDLANLTNLQDFSLSGVGGSITGTVSTSTMLRIYLTGTAIGSCVIKVDISNMPNMTYVYVYNSGGVLIGNLGGFAPLLPPAYCMLVAGGAICGGSLTYTAGAVWKNLAFSYAPTAGYGLTSTEIDNILIDMAASATTPTSKTIELRGANGARTAASDAAYTHLTVTHGCVVNTN